MDVIATLIALGDDIKFYGTNLACAAACIYLILPRTQKIFNGDDDEPPAAA